ncbi:hypothetical protein ACFY1U_47935 [Streptomyces sp. NPDC001351]|uniref:hypothetical protein n=1 Tax=Streptomyces sp. NPDC001351 TaxID=3364564 RepID=UPI00369F3210
MTGALPLAECRRRAARIRAASLEMIGECGYGFAGSCLSVADVLAAVSVSWTLGDGGPGGADVLCLSKGHAAPALYGLLHGERWREVGGYADLDSPLQGHPRRAWTADVPATSGSLGLAPAHALGGHLGRRARGTKGRLLIVVGDGELQSGPLLETLTWLGDTAAPGVLVVVDHNGWQSTGRSSRAATAAVSAAFAETRELDGNDPAQLLGLFTSFTPSTPAVLAVARTTRWAGTTVSPHEHTAMGFLPPRPQTDRMIQELWRKARS